MMEDFKKNFILLSAVAKEKKYAQEYLGLLARRGDIGSIRIGKRWYTTKNWFSEFLSDAEAKKAETKTSKNLMVTGQAAKAESEPAEAKVAEKINIEKVFLPRAVEFVPRDLPDKIEMKRETVAGLPGFSPRSGGAGGRAGLKNKANWENLYALKEEIKETVPAEKIVSKKTFSRIERELPVIDLRKKIRPQFQESEKKNFLRQKDVSEAGGKNQDNWGDWGNQKSWGTGEKLHIRSVAGGVSPSLLPERKERLPLFPKFAFAASLVLLFLLLFQIGFFYKKEIVKLARLDSRLDPAERAVGQAGFESGRVAGAQDNKIDLSAVKNYSFDCLGNQGNKVKENISLSRVLVRAAMEREK